MPDAVRDLPIVAAGLEEHVRIARAVHHLLGENRLAALLGLEHDAQHLVAVLDRIDAPGMEEHVDLRLGDHLVHEVLRALGIDRRLPVAMVLFADRARAHPVAQGSGAFGELRDQPLRDKSVFAGGLAVARGEHDQHHAVREEAAQRTVALDERHLRTSAGRRDCGSEAGRAAAHHHHVRLVKDRNLARRLQHLAADERAAGAVLDGVRKRKDVAPPRQVRRIADRARRQAAVHLDILVAQRDAADKPRPADAEALQKFAFGYLHAAILSAANNMRQSIVPAATVAADIRRCLVFIALFLAFKVKCAAYNIKNRT